MKKINLNLGSKDMGLCCPSEAATKSEEPRVYYPTFHYSGKTEMDLPSEGEMVVKFKKVGSSENTPTNGEKSYSCTLEIREIVAVSGEDKDEYEAPARNLSKETGDALDALLREKMEKREKGSY